MVAGTISMALGAYVSTKSQRELHESEEAREFWEIEHMREHELAETRRIFRLKGITGPLLDEVVEAVSRDHDQWVKLMMTEELGLPSKPPKPHLAASVMGVAFAFAAIVPVLPFFFAEGVAALTATFVMSGLALFAVGAWRATLSQGNMLRKGTEMVVLAGIAAVAAAVRHRHSRRHRRLARLLPPAPPPAPPPPSRAPRTAPRCARRRPPRTSTAPTAASTPASPPTA